MLGSMNNWRRNAPKQAEDKDGKAKPYDIYYTSLFLRTRNTLVVLLFGSSYDDMVLKQRTLLHDLDLLTIFFYPYFQM